MRRKGLAVVLAVGLTLAFAAEAQAGKFFRIGVLGPLAEPMAQREGKRRRCASQPRVTRSSVSSRSRRSPNT